MGGRGGKSSVSSYGNEPISENAARFIYHGAKHSGALERNNPDVKKISEYEKIAKDKDYSKFYEFKSSKEAEPLKFYFYGRRDNLQKKIASLGSKEEAFKHQNLLREYRAISRAEDALYKRLKEFHKAEPMMDRTKQYEHVTTTYERARKRREKNFEAWWNGSSK